VDPRFAGQFRSLEQWHWWFRGRQRILTRVLREAIGTRGSLRIASLGSGPPEGLAWLLALAGPGSRVVALDVELMHARRIRPNLDYVVGDLERTPLASASLDVVLAFDVLEHLDDDVGGLCEAARLLRPGGLLIVTVPAVPSLWGAQDVVSHHRRRYTKRLLYRAFARAHLPRPAVTYFNTLLFPSVAAVRMARHVLKRDQARSDFELNRPGRLNDLLAGVFAFERHLVYRVPLPVGSSLLATVHVSE
jgi:SAM-dependent methyltransferase